MMTSKALLIYWAALTDGFIGIISLDMTSTEVQARGCVLKYDAEGARNNL